MLPLICIPKSDINPLQCKQSMAQTDSLYIKPLDLAPKESKVGMSLNPKKSTDYFRNTKQTQTKQNTCCPNDQAKLWVSQNVHAASGFLHDPLLGRFGDLVKELRNGCGSEEGSKSYGALQGFRSLFFFSSTL